MELFSYWYWYWQILYILYRIKVRFQPQLNPKESIIKNTFRESESQF